MKCEVIFKHVADSRDSVIFEGSKKDCRHYVAAKKRDAKLFFPDRVGKWENEGFCVMGMYYVEIRKAG
jgi:hypothetical protein